MARSSHDPVVPSTDKSHYVPHDEWDAATAHALAAAASSNWTSPTVLQSAIEAANDRIDRAEMLAVALLQAIRDSEQRVRLADACDELEAARVARALLGPPTVPLFTDFGEADREGAVAHNDSRPGPRVGPRPRDPLVDPAPDGRARALSATPA